MDYERELLSRLDEMARHLAAVEEELVKFRKERFLKSVGTFLFILLPIIGVGFLVPNFIRKGLPQYLPVSARPAVESLLPADQDEPRAVPVVVTPVAPIKKPVPVSTSTMNTSTTTASTTDDEI